MENRDFKGVWIPKEIWLNKELSMIEKVLYTEISSLDNENHCVAGNEYFAEFCNCSESTITKAIKHLQDLELIEVLSFDGRHRKLALRDRVVNFTRLNSKIYEAESQNLLSINTENNKISKKPLIDKSIKGNIPKKSKSSSVETNTFIKLYNETCTNLPRCAKSTDKRDKSIMAIIKNYSLDEIKEVFTKANDSDFLIGNNDRGWKANIDFILREDKFVNILEGKYDGKRKHDTVSTEGHLKLDRNADKKKFWEDVHNGKAEKF